MSFILETTKKRRVLDVQYDRICGNILYKLTIYSNIPGEISIWDNDKKIKDGIIIKERYHTDFVNGLYKSSYKIMFNARSRKRTYFHLRLNDQNDVLIWRSLQFFVHAKKEDTPKYYIEERHSDLDFLFC